MLSYLLNLPTELLEHILVYLCHEDAQGIQACRQTCCKLNAVITQSQLVQYLERVALLGMYDPLLLVEGGAMSATLALPDRTAALRAWEESWNLLAGGYDGDARVFWQERGPDLQIALPSEPLRLWPPPLQVRYISATVIDSEPGPELLGEDGHDGFSDLACFSLRGWFIIMTCHGIDRGASYSYSDLRGCLGGVEGVGGAPGEVQVGERENVDRDRGDESDGLYYTSINIPVSDVVEFAFSAELDLAVVISATFEHQDQAYQDWERKSTHLVVRPLRFRDGTPHPCAKVQAMRFSDTGASLSSVTQARVLGDYLLLWIGPVGHTLEDFSLSRLYLIAWKQGSVTLLRECPAGKYGAVHMISDDVIVLVQLDPPGIELCRVSNMKKEAEGDSGATTGRGSPNDRPRMDKLCTLLLPPLLQPRDGTGSTARIISAYCVGDNPDHQAISRGPWSEYRCAPQGRCQLFHQSTKDSILGVEVEIYGLDGEVRTFEMVLRCATLLAYAEGAHLVPTATTAVAHPESSNGDGDIQSVSIQAVVSDANADNNAEEGVDDDDVPWDAWGPPVTALSEHRRYSLVDSEQVGERRATVERNAGQICIRDYNPYRIRQARAFMMAKGLRGHGWGDSHKKEDEEEENAEASYPKVTRRIVERSTIQGGVWSEEDMTTELPYLETKVDVPGCKTIYLEQDRIVLRVDDLDKITGRPNRMNGRRVEGFVLYNM